MRKLCFFLFLSLAAWAHIDLRLGSLRLGSSDAEVLKALGPPSSKSAPVEEAASGELVSDWRYPGLELRMAKVSGPFQLGGFTLQAPCKLRTDKNIGIGSSEAALVRAYPQAKKEQNSGYAWFDEKAYEMAMFKLKAGKVSEITVLPGPE